VSESLTTAAEIKEIRFKLEAIEATQLLLVRDRAKALLEDYLVLFAAQPDLRLVYLKVDGRRSQADIVSALKSDGTPLSQPTVSRRMQTLRDHGLIEPTGADGALVFEKNRIVEQVLRLSKRVA
jgi:DNA-binding transcriptional ArsR family regulator